MTLTTTNEIIRFPQVGKTPRHLTYEILEIDGGWLTRDGIIERTGQSEAGVSGALYDLVKRGWAEKRLRSIMRPIRIYEYRALPPEDKEEWNL